MNGDVDDAIPAGVEAIKGVIQMEGGVSEGAEDVIGGEVRIDTNFRREVGEPGEVREMAIACCLMENGVIDEVAVVIEDQGEIDGPVVEANGQEGEERTNPKVGDTNAGESV